MKSFGTLAALCLILSAIPMSSHAAALAPAKDPGFDSGFFNGSWIAEQCEGFALESGSAAEPFANRKLSISLEKGALIVADKNDPSGILSTSFGSINQGPSAGASESYTFSGGVYKSDKDGNASAMLLSKKKGAAQLTLAVQGQSLKCQLKRI
jgi:hypothetical protein